MNDNNLVVLLPAYNEENDVEKLILRWKQQEECVRQYGLELNILIVNDGSKDRTREICESLQQTYENVHLVNHEINQGLGKAVETGFKYILEQYVNCTYVCLMDCDNTQSPQYIEDMLKKIEDHKNKVDVVIASRYQKGAKVYGVAWYRKLTSEGARWLYSCLFHIKNVRDYTCGFRLYKSSILKNAFQMFEGQFIEQSGFTCMAEILYKLSCIDAKFAEVPFKLHYDAKGGMSKMKVLKTAKDSFSLAFNLRKVKRKVH